MGRLLAHRGSRAAYYRVALFLCVSPALAEPPEDDRHRFDLEFDIHQASTSTQLDPWIDGGLGKLRLGESGSSLDSNRILLDYRGRISPTLRAHAVVDYVDDGSDGIDLTEAYLLWRPVPTSPNQQQWRIGAFYPGLSFENSDRGWSSPYTLSPSAINTWIGEEIRPIGAEWSLRRRLGGEISPHALRVSAAAFYGNDPAGTLLWWRGWALHDRQTRINDKLPLPPFPVLGTNQFEAQQVQPIDEIDHSPGYYVGAEWRYASRVRLELARYDNRADVNAFSDGQWGWRTAFHHLALQVALPGDVGLVSQWMDGATAWISGARPSGLIYGPGDVVKDHFASRFVLLTKVLGTRHRISARYDEFDIWRHDSTIAGESDRGNAWTFAYRFAGTDRLLMGLEWLEVESSRDLWSNFYGLPRSARETQLRVELHLRLDY
jgi:hypothetical protein